MEAVTSTVGHVAMAKVVQRDCQEALAELLDLCNPFQMYEFAVLATSADRWFSNLTRITE